MEQSVAFLYEVKVNVFVSMCFLSVDVRSFPVFVFGCLFEWH